MLAILQEGESYGYAIMKRVAELSGGELDALSAAAPPGTARLHQASRISGVSPADLSILLVQLSADGRTRTRVRVREKVDRIHGGRGKRLDVHLLACYRYKPLGVQNDLRCTLKFFGIVERSKQSR